MKRAPKVIEPVRMYSGGYVVQEATSDTGSWFTVKVATCTPVEADPLVCIELDRRHAQMMGNPRCVTSDWIENFRASDLDRLIEALQAAVTVAREHGVIPKEAPGQ